MKYCFECGTLLVDKPLKKEGMIPYCSKCEAFRFPIFSSAVSMIIHNPSKDKILLIKQYGTGNNVLVAGYINKGENAENAVIREAYEEIGLRVGELRFNKSEYFPKTNTLMLNYSCVADTEALDGMNTEEVDEARWFTFEEARNSIMTKSLAKRFLLNYLDDI